MVAAKAVEELSESEPRTVLNPSPGKMASLLRAHWPEYLMEAGELAVYMFFTCDIHRLDYRQRKVRANQKQSIIPCSNRVSFFCTWSFTIFNFGLA